MLQYILLFFEIVLLAAIGYIYWRTRMLATHLHTLVPPALSTAEHTESQTEMMREVATLITEWEGVTDAVRADLSYQQVKVGETLEQAETTIVKLQELVARADTLTIQQTELQSAHHAIMPNPDSSKNHSDNTTPTTLVEAIKIFSEYLRANHYGQSSVTRTVNYVQKFAAWLGGQAEVELPLRPVVLAEIELYRRRLEAQQTPADAVEREVAALKMFANWINTLVDKTYPEASCPTVLPSVQPEPKQLLAAKLSDQSFARYHTAFALARQGTAPAIITAQTGLEREAVRLLLTMGRPSPGKN